MYFEYQICSLHFRNKVTEFRVHLAFNSLNLPFFYRDGILGNGGETIFEKKNCYLGYHGHHNICIL